MNDLEQRIYAVVTKVVRDRSPDAPEVAPHHGLTTELGLESLDLARIVASLELELEADPFSSLVPITDVRTVGDLVSAYRRWFDGETAGDGPSAALERASARRRAKGVERRAARRRGGRGEGSA